MSAEADPRQPASGKGLWLVLSAVCFGLMYLYWPTESFVEAEDSITFFGRILAGEPFFHTNHLLFEPFYHIVLKLFDGLFPGLLLLQGLTALFALLGLLGLYLLVARRKGWVAGLLVAWLVATTFGYWHYGKVVDAYVPALASAIWAFVLYDQYRRQRSTVALVLMALTLSAAVLLHQLYIVLALMMCLALLVERQPGAAARLAGIGLAIVGGTYVLVYLSIEIETRSLGDFITWGIGRAKNGLWDPPDGSTPLKAVMGLTRVFIHISALFTTEGAVSAATNAIGIERLVEEIFLARSALTSPLALALPLLVIGYVLALLVLIPGGLMTLARNRLDAVDWLLVAVILVYTVLVLVWEASNNEFWIHIVAFLFVLFAGTLENSKFRISTAAVAIALALVINFSAGIRPLSDARNDYWAKVRADITRAIPEDSLIVVECVWLCRKYLRLSDHRYYFISSFDVYERLNGVEMPTPEEPFYLTSWALAPVFGTPPHERARRETGFADFAATFGPLPSSSQDGWTDTPRVWKWDGAWQPVDG